MKEDEFMTFIAERVALKPNIRGVILSAVLREVATKEDIEKLRDETREEIEKLREEIRGEMNTRFSSLEQRVSSLEQRMSKIEGQLSLLIRIFIAFNLPILIGIIGILLRSYVP